MAYLSSNGIWGVWTTATSDTSTSNNYYATSTQIWTGWNSGTTSSTTGSIWSTWTRDEYAQRQQQASYQRAWNQWQTVDYRTQPVTKISLSERNQAKLERVWTSWQKECEAKDAELTAQELLEEIIGTEELEVYKETGRVLVRGRKHDYLLEKTGKVTRVEKDKLVDLCIHFKRTETPATDKVIGLKLMIEGEEKEFNRRANRISSRTKPQELPKAACM